MQCGCVTLGHTRPPSQELDAVPRFLTWLRYTTFYVLYPLGVASEMTMVALALPVIHRERLLSMQLPNTLNFGFDYTVACVLIVIGYLPGMDALWVA